VFRYGPQDDASSSAGAGGFLVKVSLGVDGDGGGDGDSRAVTGELAAQPGAQPAADKPRKHKHEQPSSRQPRLDIGPGGGGSGGGGGGVVGGGGGYPVHAQPVRVTTSAPVKDPVLETDGFF